MTVSMTTALMAKLQDHATGYATWDPPEAWYVAYFKDGAEVAGGSYSRKLIPFAAAVVLSVTDVRSGSSAAQIFENLGTFDVDEIRIVDSPSGAPTLTGWIIPHVQSFTAGDDQGYAADKIAVHLGNPA